MTHEDAIAGLKRLNPWLDGYFKYSHEFREFILRGAAIGTINQAVVDCVCKRGWIDDPTIARLERVEYSEPDSTSIPEDYCFKLYNRTVGAGTLLLRVDVLLYAIVHVTGMSPWKSKYPVLESVHTERDPDDCPACGTRGFRHRMACICPKCRYVIWGC